MINKKSSKWYDNAVLTNVLLILFFPVGLYALWKSNTIAKWWKVTATVIIALIVIRNLGSGNGVATINEEEKIEVSSQPELTRAQMDSIMAAEKALEIRQRQQSTINAGVLFQAYSDNEVKADQNYKGKNFHVVGYIDDIGKDILDDIYVTLKSDELIFGVQCYIRDEDVVASLKKGMKVTVWGTCNGKLGNVFMKNCEIVQNLEDL